MRKSILLTIILAATVLSFSATLVSQNTSSPEGYWVTDDGDSRIEIFKRSDKFFGRIAALKYPLYHKGEERGMDGKPRADIHNPDPALRSRPIIGLEIISGFSAAGNKFTGGKIYDPDSGKTYDCEMWIDASGNLNVRGFIGVSALGRTEKFYSLQNYCKREMRFMGLTEAHCEKQ